MQLLVYKRATRSVPGSGDIWARYIRLLVRFHADYAFTTNLVLSQERAEQGDEIECKLYLTECAW